MYFSYGEKEKEYLKGKDKKLAAIIEQVGHIYRETDEGLFSSVIRHIIGQQISTAAQITIWNRLLNKIDEKEQDESNINAENLLDLGRDELQKIGMTFKKADYILEFAKKVKEGSFNLEKLHLLTDDEVIKEISSLSGIGVWTAEMIMIFCMQRQNILSYGDLAIQRGMRMIYRHRKIDKIKFENYKKRYSPYASVASLYIWAAAGGAIDGLSDPAPKKTKSKNDKSKTFK